MPLDLNTSIEFLKNRVDATLSVQTQIAATWTWPLRTVAEWQSDSLQLDRTLSDTVASRAIAASTQADVARGRLDTRLATIHTQTNAVVGVMRVRAERAPQHRPVVDELSARGDSRRAIEEEGTGLLSAWQEEFGGAAFVPSSEFTFASFQKLFLGDPAVPPLPTLRALKQALSDAVTLERSRVGALNVLLTRAERDVQDWYAEATSVLAAGTVNGDLVRTVPTTTSYNPATAATKPPGDPTP
jgi:hypothetical protein